jgi:hypothetical protein
VWWIGHQGHVVKGFGTSVVASDVLQKKPPCRQDI